MKFALIGGKLGHSYSAIIHDLFFKLTGIKGSYELVEIPSADNLSEKMNFFEQNGYAGINITIPYKKDILKLANEISEEVIKLEAANTIHFSNGRRVAYNTDYFGFKRTLELSKVDPKGQKWLVLGYGGGAKSAIAVLKDMNTEEISVSLTSQSGNMIIPFDMIGELKGYSGVVNTTPVGMYPNINNSPLSINMLNNFQTAVDIVYNPLETKFLKDAQETGLKTVKGLYMLVAQAIKAQEIWQNREFSDDLIDQIYQKVGAGL